MARVIRWNPADTDGITWPQFERLIYGPYWNPADPTESNGPDYNLGPWMVGGLTPEAVSSLTWGINQIVYECFRRVWDLHGFGGNGDRTTNPVTLNFPSGFVPEAPFNLRFFRHADQGAPIVPGEKPFGQKIRDISRVINMIRRMEGQLPFDFSNDPYSSTNIATPGNPEQVYRQDLNELRQALDTDKIYIPLAERFYMAITGALVPTPELGATFLRSNTFVGATQVFCLGGDTFSFLGQHSGSDAINSGQWQSKIYRQKFSRTRQPGLALSPPADQRIDQAYENGGDPTFPWPFPTREVYNTDFYEFFSSCANPNEQYWAPHGTFINVTGLSADPGTATNMGVYSENVFNLSMQANASGSNILTHLADAVTNDLCVGNKVLCIVENGSGVRIAAKEATIIAITFFDPSGPTLGTITLTEAIPAGTVRVYQMWRELRKHRAPLAFDIPLGMPPILTTQLFIPQLSERVNTGGGAINIDVSELAVGDFALHARHDPPCQIGGYWNPGTSVGTMSHLSPTIVVPNPTAGLVVREQKIFLLAGTLELATTSPIAGDPIDMPIGSTPTSLAGFTPGGLQYAQILYFPNAELFNPNFQKISGKMITIRAENNSVFAVGQEALKTKPYLVVTVTDPP